MSRSFRHDKYKYKYKYKDGEPIWDEYPSVLFDDSQLSAADSMSANSNATGNLSISKSLSSKARKRADKQFRKQRRHDERL